MSNSTPFADQLRHNAATVRRWYGKKPARLLDELAAALEWLAERWERR
jgi:hypothetical protein